MAGVRWQQLLGAKSRKTYKVEAGIEVSSMMTFQEKRGSDYRILYEPSSASQIEPKWFATEFWQQQDKLLGGAPGRGTSCFVQGPQQKLVLRHYHRGGMVGRILHDRYLWTGWRRTRPWQEMAILAELWRRGLPVPAPVAAKVQRVGLCWYRADLLTGMLPDVEPLADVVAELPLAMLHYVGKTIRRFHDEGLHHVDLNPRNIVINSVTEEVFVLDFDRCQLFDKPLDPLRARRNLARLERGFMKLNAHQAQDWSDAVEHGYYTDE